MATMRLRTKKSALRTVAARWERQYRGDPQWYSKHEILKKCRTEQEVNDAIGNDSWTRLECCICGKDSAVAVNFAGEDNYYEICVCESCLRKSLRAIENRKERMGK